MHFNFYYDEIYPEKKISLSPIENKNIFRENNLEKYIGVFWGCNGTVLKKIEKQLYKFEEKQKTLYGLNENSELKSSIIKQPNFKFGIKTFNRNAMSFYKDLFSLLNNSDITLHIIAISKIELFVQYLTDELDLPHFVNKNKFCYSLTKFIYIYHNEQMLVALNDAVSIKDELVSQLSYVISAIEDIPRKEQELPALKQIKYILNCSNGDINLSDKYDFSYYPIFDGLKKLLLEKNIPLNKVHLTIDEQKETYNEGLNHNLKSIQQARSHENIKVRLSDQLCGFIGRIIFAMENDQQKSEDRVARIENVAVNDLTTKRILSDEWFDLNKEQFELYKLIYQALVLNHQYYWTSMTLSYGDQIAYFCALLHYIGSYADYPTFHNITPSTHSNNCSNVACTMLNRQFTNM